MMTVAHAMCNNSKGWILNGLSSNECADIALKPSCPLTNQHILNITDSAQLRKGNKTVSFGFSVNVNFESIGFGATSEV
jgi:hypothetical protein